MQLSEFRVSGCRKVGWLRVLQTALM